MRLQVEGSLDDVFDPSHHEAEVATSMRLNHHRQFGFVPLAAPQRMMEITRPDIYRTPAAASRG